MKNRTQYFLMVFLFLTGCSTDILVKDISQVNSGDKIDGVPFRTKSAQILRVYMLQKDGEYKEVKVFHEEMADFRQLYSIGFDSGLFSDHSLTLNLEEGGTLSSLDLKTSQKVDEALAGLHEGTKLVTDAVIARNDKKNQLIKDEETKAVSTEDARLSAVSARHETEALEDKLENLLEDSPLEERNLLVRQIELSKLKTNALYRRASMIPPYDVKFPQ